jgi:hypothetical protein
MLMLQCVIYLSCFIVDKIWSTAIKIIYQICFYNPNRDLEKTLRNPKSRPTGVTFVCKIAWWDEDNR